MHHPLYDRPTNAKPASAQPTTVEPLHDNLVVFDEPAVNDNYDGKLAPDQIRQLRQQIIPNVLWTLTSFSLTLFLALTSWNPKEPAHSFIALLILLALCAGVSFTWLRNIFTLRMDITQKAVSYTDGVLFRSSQLHHRDGKNAKPFYTYHLTINGLKFKVTPEIFMSCEPKGTYRVYYTTFGKEVVNLHSL